MRLIALCHQKFCRNFRVFSDNASSMVITIIFMIVVESCFHVYRALQANNIKETVNYIMLFLLINMTVLYIFNNGQRLLNQNDILRKHLSELPWTDKPRWFRQTVHIMMTRANIDIQLKPYGIFVLNLMSFKEMMKFIGSSANVLYTVKHSNKSL
ncbi:uncharacterized protein LOC120351132 [Nilaparvata lugens]|uniref:uncharacterized protein LOC120351132 n=1 Tax=Nilaparvata lugens TaxID=108931 RepID=UPI00193D8505|nr:uncharacterized protein LOC120351132 [Nilaparvata lugens]